MPLPNEQINQLSHLLENAENVLVLLGSKPKLNDVTSALTLHYSLLAAGKKSVLASDSAPLDPGKVLGVDQVVKEIGNQALHITFPYSPESVNKVSYHIDEDTNQFFLVVKPQRGSTPLQSSEVSYAYAGVEADLIFLVGVRDFSQLGELYENQPTAFENITSVSINMYAASVGSIALDGAGATCLSEFTYSVLSALGFSIDADSATNLLTGIEEATQSFTSLSTTADALQTASQLMRLGARRVNRILPTANTAGTSANTLKTISSTKSGGKKSGMTSKKNSKTRPKQELPLKQEVPLAEAMSQKNTMKNLNPPEEMVSATRK